MFLINEHHDFQSRELEEQNEQLKSGKLSTSFDCSDIQDRSGLNVSAIDCSYYRKAEDGSVLINKRVGLYVEQLKNKVLRLQHKVKMLRDQRNKSNAQLQTWAKYFASLEGQQTKIKVLAVDMDDEMQQFAVSTAAQAFETGRQEREIANQIKKSFDNQYQFVWNCVVGRDFGSHIVHQTKRYIFMSYYDSVFVLLWKSN